MTRRLLAIESATDWLSVALLDAEDVVVLSRHEGTRQHAAALLPVIDGALSEAGWTLSTLDAMAVSTGPGSFTSLRIGLATLKGLAFGRELQAIGVSTLEAMALSVLEDRSQPAIEVVALLDARRGEWYAGGWTLGAEERLHPTLAEGLYDPAQLAADLARSAWAISPERGDWRAQLGHAGLEFAEVVEGEAARPRADWVGRIAQRRLARGEGGPVEALAARYLRRAEAEAKRLGAPVEAGEVARLGESAR